MPDVLIAGGGLAGLVAARHLADAGIEVQLFERREEVGGRVRSIRRDGFVMDRGFQVLFTAYPAARRELDYDALELREFRPGAVIASTEGRAPLVDPFRNPTAISAALLSPAITFRDKLTLYTLRRRLSKADPETFFEGPDASIRGGLAQEGFSDRFIDNFAEPFYGGITLDRSLSTSMAVFEYTFTMLLSARAAVPATGMGAIPEQLAAEAEQAGARIETGRTVETVDAGESGEEVTVDLASETVTADAAVVATDPSTASELTGVESIPTKGWGCVTQFYTLPAGSELELDKRILLNADGGDGPNQIVGHSEVAPGHAPVGQSLLSATYLDADDVEDASEATLAERTRDALERWYPERRFDELATLHTERIPFAQFEQPPGFRSDLPDPDAPEGPVTLAGDYTQWSSIQGALESGRNAALTTLDELGP